MRLTSLVVEVDCERDKKFVRDVEQLVLERHPSWERLFGPTGTLTITWNPDTVPGNVPPLQRNDK